MKRKPARTRFGLLVGIGIIVDIVILYIHLNKLYKEEGELVGYLVQNTVQLPMILGFLAGAASITAFFARFKYAHLIGLVLMVIAIILIPANAGVTVFVIDALLLLVAFIVDLCYDIYLQRRVDNFMSGKKELYDYTKLIKQKKDK